MTMTDSDDVGKLFVGGLSWETTQNALLSYFSRFGEVVDCVVMKNNETGRSRGFGFVTFKDPNCVAIVLQAKPHELNGRTIDAKECTPRSMQNKQGKRNGGSSSQAKIFLGGLPPDVTEAAVRNAMSRFGNVTQVLIMFDSETKKCRGFGFLSFDSEESIERACAEHFVTINGKQIECKRAQPREEYNRRNSGQPNMYGNSGNDFPRSSFGAMNTSEYQNNWNTPTPPSYGMQGNSYGGYQKYEPPTGGGATGYYSSSTSYSSMPESQYSMPAYSSYGAQSTSMPSVPTYNYNQPPANNYSSSTSYSETSSYPGANTQTSAMGGGSYGGNAYTQDSSYAPAKAHGGISSKMPTTGGMGYHPYRR